MDMAADIKAIKQHLIDPEICIRCNTCEEACPDDAITHNSLNYVIDFHKCTRKGDCLLQCPTGAIDSFRMVTEPWTVDDSCRPRRRNADRHDRGPADVAGPDRWP